MPPQRIVSLVPSLTELVFWLGAGDRLVGRTRYCSEPAGSVDAIPAMGGTKNPSLEKIRGALPDLVLANKEENRREDIDALRAAGLPVLLTDPNTVLEALAMIRQVGETLETAEKAEELATEVEAVLAELPAGPLVRVYVGVWHSPMMGLGANSYGHSLIELSGAENVLAPRQRYPQVTIEELRALAPELILLPDEPFPFDACHAALYGEVAPAKVVDGKLLWWYGPRMPAAIRELRAIFQEAAAN